MLENYMNIKKISLLIMTIILAVTLSACGGSGDGDNSNNTPSPTKAESIDLSVKPEEELVILAPDEEGILKLNTTARGLSFGKMESFDSPVARLITELNGYSGADKPDVFFRQKENCNLSSSKISCDIVIKNNSKKNVWISGEERAWYYADQDKLVTGNMHGLNIIYDENHAIQTKSDSSSLTVSFNSEGVYEIRYKSKPFALGSDRYYVAVSSDKATLKKHYTLTEDVDKNHKEAALKEFGKANKGGKEYIIYQITKPEGKATEHYSEYKVEWQFEGLENNDKVLFYAKAEKDKGSQFYNLYLPVLDGQFIAQNGQLIHEKSS